MIDTLSKFGVTFNNWLNSVNSTNAKAIGTLVLYFLTWAVYAAAVLFKVTIDNIAFGMWLGFLAGLGGFSLMQFKTQRQTDYGALTRQADIERAKAGATTTTTETAGPTKTTTAPAPEGDKG